MSMPPQASLRLGEGKGIPISISRAVRITMAFSISSPKDVDATIGYDAIGLEGDVIDLAI